MVDDVIIVIGKKRIFFVMVCMWHIIRTNRTKHFESSLVFTPALYIVKHHHGFCKVKESLGKIVYECYYGQDLRVEPSRIYSYADTSQFTKNSNTLLSDVAEQRCLWSWRFRLIFVLLVCPSSSLMIFPSFPCGQNCASVVIRLAGRNSDPPSIVDWCWIQIILYIPVVYGSW